MPVLRFGCPVAELLGSATGAGVCVLQRSTDCRWTVRYTVERATLNSSASSLARGMCTRAVHVHQVALLGCRQLWLLAAEVAFRFSHLHSLSGSCADEVGFELCHHRENVEQ